MDFFNHFRRLAWGVRIFPRVLGGQLQQVDQWSCRLKQIKLNGKLNASRSESNVVLYGCEEGIYPRSLSLKMVQFLLSQQKSFGIPDHEIDRQVSKIHTSFIKIALALLYKGNLVC